MVSSIAAALSVPVSVHPRDGLSSDHTSSLHLIARRVRPRRVGLMILYPSEIFHVDDATARFRSAGNDRLRWMGRPLDAPPDHGAARKLRSINHGISLKLRLSGRRIGKRQINRAGGVLKHLIKENTMLRRLYYRMQMARAKGQSDETRIVSDLVRGAPRTFVEFGFHPIEFNCAAIARDPQWRGLLIDGNARQVADARAILPDRIEIEQKFLTLDNTTLSNFDLDKSAFCRSTSTATIIGFSIG
jgi:hypothetical protein